jgi:hypothetical protein
MRPQARSVDSGHRGISLTDRYSELMLPCCLDESTDQKCEQVFVVGGFIAPHLIQWFEAERLWQKRLEQYGIDYFRSSDCQSMRGPFEKLRREPAKNVLTRSERKKADSIRNDLIKLIVDCEFMGFGFGIFLADYEAVKRRGAEERRLLGPVPYHLAYQLAMTHAALILHDTDDLKEPSLDLSAMSTRSILFTPRIRITNSGKRVQL